MTLIISIVWVILTQHETYRKLFVNPIDVRLCMFHSTRLTLAENCLLLTKTMYKKIKSQYVSPITSQVFAVIIKDT